jgi:hypothetical protein
VVILSSTRSANWSNTRRRLGSGDPCASTALPTAWRSLEVYPQMFRTYFATAGGGLCPQPFPMAQSSETNWRCGL